MTTPIPAPRGLPLIGNVFNIDPEYPIDSISHLAEIHGPIFKLTTFGNERLIVANHALFEELCDEKRFQKSVAGPLEQIRNGVRDGLFTAYQGEHNWEIAHRTLMPAFGPMPIRSMFSEMHDIASQLVMKWARFGPHHDIDVSSDFTRLTLDTIALCAMGTRFNSFYHEEMHPFVDAMVGLLVESGNRARRPGIADSFFRAERQRYDRDIALLQKTAMDLIEDRRKNPTDKPDLLNAMLNGRDPRTGEGLTTDSIVNNMITFLIAGHETTSGLLSFLFVELLQNPDAYRRAQKEVDQVVGTAPVTVDHMSKLPYLTACLREALRLHPTAPGFSVSAKEDEVIGGQYLIKKGQTALCFLVKIQTDPEVYGEDADKFRPERMMEENFSKLPKEAWKPFGNGMRGCIGRPFAWQEALLTVALLLQTFDFTASDPNYQLKIQSTLTIKPKNFHMRAAMRRPEAISNMTFHGEDDHAKEATKQRQAKTTTGPGKDAPTLSIYYGSNTGTCESLASSLASAAASHGFNSKVDILDKAADSLPAGQPTVIITASYEGQPPDNAGRFVGWLEEEKASLNKINYAVFGCGNRDWVSTYQRIPTLVDDTLAKKGASRITERGFADANDGEIFNNFDKWSDEQLWPALQKTYGTTTNAADEEDAGLNVKVETTGRSARLRQDLQSAMVTETRLLTAAGKPAKRHIELQLPTGATYKAGDYLAVLPLNPIDTVRRAMARFQLPWDATIELDNDAKTTIPTGRPVSAFDVLSAFVELSQPVTAKQLRAVADTIPDTAQASEVRELSSSKFATVQSQNTSLLDILERYPNAAFTLGQFLAALPAMRTRQYSISSSPLASPQKVTLTYSVLDAPSLSAPSPTSGSKAGSTSASSEPNASTTTPITRRHLGVCSTYLSQLQPGDVIQVALRPSHTGFHLPLDASKPIIMACAGTGLAPFRAFVQERAEKIRGGAKLGPALLFYGCRSPEEDDLYRSELDKWEAEGAVSVRRAYSVDKEKSEGCKHVQERIWKDREEARELFKQGAGLYVCGSGRVGKGVGDVIVEIRKASKGDAEEEAREWLNQIRGERYWADIFS
ncbi:Cytochrome P450-like protein 65 [Elsinoe fawcettii]|nr:Cytochrome P450-like protein 65 [Elsinoe fawcettii]